ncbi:colicin V production CvpA [Actibacterium mucosum KCTC 23349]|uniref:Colicin V production CvpA n=1 Tax=Actibacterium mucosum KCTC 23349 TaxID=1454373 RepID=A0A037ZGE7_9RHOB|nr:CvpA family protein [Actibacterium mucosum]KAJ55520.1 colicin V production CvpA [Actibacterium mucosum KCTC 23349]
MDFTVVDAIVAVIIVLSAILAYSRGLVREALAILGWVAAAIAAYIFAPQAEPLIRQVPFVGDFLVDSCEISLIAAFAAVFAVGLVVVSIFTPLFASAVQRSALGGIDQALGFLFGAARGVLLVAVAFFVYSAVITTEPFPQVENSQSAKIFNELTAKIAERDPQQAVGWLTGYYEDLVGQCNAPTE